MAVCHLQGPEFGHVVETGHGQPADVVVVQGADEETEGVSFWIAVGTRREAGGRGCDQCNF